MEETETRILKNIVRVRETTIKELRPIWDATEDVGELLALVDRLQAENDKLVLVLNDREKALAATQRNRDEGQALLTMSKGINREVAKERDEARAQAARLAEALTEEVGYGDSSHAGYVLSHADEAWLEGVKREAIAEFITDVETRSEEWTWMAPTPIHLGVAFGKVKNERQQQKANQ